MSPSNKSLRRRWRLSMFVTGLLACGQVGAVFTYLPYADSRFIQLQVGAAGAISTVHFDVVGASTSPTPSPVIGVPDAGSAGTSSSGGIRVRMLGQWNNGNQGLKLTVNSVQGLACAGGSGCGNTVIPFSTIGWVAQEKLNNTAADIQNGYFWGSADQLLANFSCCDGGTVEMANTLVFTYDNATLYPAGRYEGRVVFTASML